MKYETPKYNFAEVKSEDILTASGDKYEVENDNGKGSVIMNAFDIFKK